MSPSFIHSKYPQQLQQTQQLLAEELRRTTIYHPQTRRRPRTQTRRDERDTQTSKLIQV
ncbi:hypothetical protein GCM10010201_36160 [Pilimelia columellifera subsp. columellifera]|uniref:Uncharacterized protein n=1 Tax=Pilimelia columellifera subsp. columellifera TaxID=706583 RepID=A0ABN3NSH9_9ACTN